VDQAAHLDFTNPSALSLFRQRLEFIQENFGIDTFKFDAGETNYYPVDPVLRGDNSLSPNHLARPYLELAATFGNKVEVRNGWGTQHLPIFLRMLDFDSRWTEQNGLKSLIPTLLQSNFNGYVFVLPDMIGGNEYGNDKLTKELFIRWLQASVFMPSLQFSVVPWQFDKETIDISKRYTKLHEQYSDLIMERFALGVSDGHPVNPPIWWLDPEDKEAQTVADGEDDSEETSIT
jgi:myogenesis-regulating glycosidase